MMTTNYLSINDKYYAVDVNKIFEFIDGVGSTVQNIHQVYGISSDEKEKNDTLQLITKEISESKEDVNDIISTNRYNLIITFLNLILMPISDANGDIVVTRDFSNMHIGQKLSFNTLLEMGIIYEIEFED